MFKELRKISSSSNKTKNKMSSNIYMAEINKLVRSKNNEEKKNKCAIKKRKKES